MKPRQESELINLQMYRNNVVHTSGENFSTMSFYEMFVMISYLMTFVYHILIHHFFYLPGFLKKKKTIYYFLKKQSYFYTKLSFQVTKKSIQGTAEHAVFPGGGSQYYEHKGSVDKPHLCCARTPACGWGRPVWTLQSQSNQFNPTLGKRNRSSIEFCSHAIILFLSKVLKEPKFSDTRMYKCLSLLYERVEGSSNDSFTYK